MFLFSGIKLPGPGTFNIPHSLALDDSHHRLYVADRENGRVQTFDTRTGTFQKEISLPEFEGRVFAVDFSKRHGRFIFAELTETFVFRRKRSSSSILLCIDDIIIMTIRTFQHVLHEVGSVGDHVSTCVLSLAPTGESLYGIN